MQDNIYRWKYTGRCCTTWMGIRAVDLHSFFADPDPAVFLNADPDPDPGGKKKTHEEFSTV